MDYQGKKVLVVGAGVSGVAAGRFLRKKGAKVTLTDAANLPDNQELWSQLRREGLELSLGVYPEVTKGSYDLVLLSPGAPLTVAPSEAAKAAGIPVTGELELAYQYSRGPIVAITGTNGKTTTTALIGAIFQKDNRRVLVGGNIGLPLISAVEDYGSQDVIVAEVSSFQLETAADFRPKVSIILNITEDHLDRHGTMQHYQMAKAKIFAKQQKNDFTVLNQDDPLIAPLGKDTAGQAIFFSRKEILGRGVFVENGEITVQINDVAERILPVTELGIPGSHNLENALAAVAAAKVMGVSNQVLAAALREFPGVPHRLEFVAEVNGVRYINDSKGTNPDASIKALEAYEDPIVLIAGGRNKGSDFGELAAKVQERARALVALGECADEVIAAAQGIGFADIRRAADLPEAVAIAAQAAQPGDVVLLSPACASWDMFRNFEERGDLFKKLVLSLNKEPQG